MHLLDPRLSARVVIALFVLAPAVASADALDDDPTPPEVSITKPAGRTELPAGTTKTTIEVKASDEESGIGEVRLLVDGKAVKTLSDDPFVFADIELAVGTHEIVAEAVNGFVEEAQSEPITIVVAAAVVEPVADTKVEPADAKAEPADAKAEPADVKEAKAAADPKATVETKAAADAKTPATDTKAEPAAKDGCFASARPRSLIGSGVAFALAAFAGLMLRRRA